MNYRYSLLIPVMLVVLLFVGSVSAPVLPAIPSPPYVPKSPQEDIVKVEAWIEQPHDQLTLKVTFAAVTPPAGQQLTILVSILESSGEHTLNAWVLVDPAISHFYLRSGFDDPNTPIAVYAYLGVSGTDRAPNSGFYQVTASLETAPNVFYDPEPAPVGGVVVSTDKLGILTPYLALAGLVAVVSAVVVVKKRIVC